MNLLDVKPDNAVLLSILQKQRAHFEKEKNNCREISFESHDGLNKSFV